MTDSNTTGAASNLAANAGELLREARESRGLAIDALAAIIKVAPAKLEALESGQYQLLPDANFTRALAMTVCRSLKVDPTPVLAALPAAIAIPLLPTRPALNQPFKETRGASLSFDSGVALDLKALLKIQWLAPIFLLLAALGVYLLPDSFQLPSFSSEPAKEVTDVASAPAAVEPAASVATQSLAVPEIVPSASASAVSTMPAASAASSVATSASVPAVLASAPSAGPLSLTSHESAWVDVRDAKGTVLISRQLKAGETVDLDGPKPFKLHLGNSSGLEISYQGQPVDLVAYTRNNVARFELK